MIAYKIVTGAIALVIIMYIPIILFAMAFVGLVAWLTVLVIQAIIEHHARRTR